MTIELRLSSVSVLLSWLGLDFLASSSFSLDFLRVLLMAHSRRRQRYAKRTAVAAMNPPIVTTMGIVPDLMEKTVMVLLLLLPTPLGGAPVGTCSTLVELLPVIGVSLVRLFGVVVVELVSAGTAASAASLLWSGPEGSDGGGG